MKIKALYILRGKRSTYINIVNNCTSTVYPCTQKDEIDARTPYTCSHNNIEQYL